MQVGAKAVVKKEGDGHSYPAGAYLVVEDESSPSSWHLRFKDDTGISRTLCGAAWAALHGGYRGQKYQGPNKAEAIAKLKRIYKSQGWDLPDSDGGSGGKSDDLDATTVLQQATEFLAEFGHSVKAGRRHSAETRKAVQMVVDHLTSTFGLAEDGKDGAGDDGDA